MKFLALCALALLGLAFIPSLPDTNEADAARKIRNRGRNVNVTVVNTPAIVGVRGCR